jgi:competence protein ComEC
LGTAICLICLAGCAPRFPGSAASFRELLGTRQESDDAAFVMTFFECGIGDAVLLEMPGGRTVLVDTGVGWRVDHILGYFEARGIDKLDALVVTHPHRDHYGGAQAIVEALPVGVFLDNGAACDESHWRDLMSALESAGISRRALRRGEKPAEIAGDGVVLEVLFPDDEAVARAGRFFGDQNRGSLVLLVTHRDARFLLMGDAESWEEEILLAWDRDRLCADVLKLGHHVSPGSSTSRFLDVVRPTLAIGQGTEILRVPPFYPRPSPFVVNRLREIDAKLLLSGESGAIQVVSDTDGIRWRTMSGESGTVEPKGAVTPSVGRTVR